MTAGKKGIGIMGVLAISAARIAGGILVMYLGFSGMCAALLVDRGHATGMIIAVTGVFVSILFMLAGAAMIMVGIRESKKRLKVSPGKTDTKEKK